MGQYIRNTTVLVAIFFSFSLTFTCGINHESRDNTQRGVSGTYGITSQKEGPGAAEEPSRPGEDGGRLQKRNDDSIVEGYPLFESMFFEYIKRKIACRHWIQSAVILNDRVYVLCSGDNKLHVYQVTGTQQLIGDIYLSSDSRTPVQVVGCVQTNSLLVLYERQAGQTDTKDAIYKVNLSNTRVGLWKSGDIKSISVSRQDAKVTVLTRSRKLKFYGPLGRQLKVVRLPRKVKDVTAVVEARFGMDVYIAHRAADGQGWTVSKLSVDRQILSTFSPSGDLSLSSISSLAVDNIGQVLVADTERSRVLGLTADLSRGQVLLDEQEVRQPREISFSLTEQLLVIVSDQEADFETYEATYPYPRVTHTT